MNLFMNHPGQSFYVREITRMIDEQINSVRRELANLMEVGVIISSSTDNKLFYEVNQRYDYYLAMRAMFAGEPIHPEKMAISDDNGQIGEIITGISQALRLALVAGVLVKGSASPLDVMLVGNLPKDKVTSAMKMIEKIEGREINYAVLPYDEFYHRLSVHDKFITQVINNKHSVIIDTDNVLSQN